MKCLKKIAIFSLVFFVSLFFIMPVQAKSTQTYSIIYDLQDASGNKIAQVKYKNKDFTSEIGSEIKVRTTYFDKKYGDFDLVSEQSQKVEAGKDQYIFVYRTYQPITIKGKVQFTTKEGTILLQDTFDIDSSATVETPQVYAVPDSYTIGDVTYLKMPGQVSEIKSVYYNDPSDNTYSITYYNPNNTTDYDVALKYVEEGTNDVLMQKSFHVNNQDYTYVLPKTMKINDIYYGLAENQENIIHHAVSSDVREYTVYYKKMDENASYKWSIYKVDASTNKILGEVVQLEVQPGQSVEYQVEKEYKDSDGNVYTVDQGMSQVLKHSYGESEHVSYVYYNPKGYTAPKSYIVEVQYKNIATGGYKMDLGFTDTKIEEDVDKDGKHVVITNVGDYDCFVRIKVFAADNLKIKYNLGKDWQESDDGYIYYNKVLSSKDKTSELNIKYTLPEVNDDNKDNDYNIVVIQEFTPVVYDDQGNLIANWQQVYETE